MAKLPITLLCILLLAGLASASCRTYNDMFYNTTLDTSNSMNISLFTTIGTTGTNCVNINHPTYGNISYNADGMCETHYNLSNVRIRVVNGTAGSNEFNVYRIEEPGISRPTFFLNKTGGSCVGTCVAAYAEFYFNGTADSISYPVIDPDDVLGWIGAGVTAKTVQPQELSIYYRRNWTFKNESNNEIFDFTGYNTTLKVWCNTLSDFTINASTEIPAIGATNDIVIQTRERPKYIFTSTDFNALRVRQDSSISLRDNYWLTTNANKNDFTLQDYSGGDFYASTITIQRSIGDSFQNVHVERFDQSNTLFAWLYNDTQYKILLEGENSIRDLGPLFIEGSDTDHNVQVSTPDFSQYYLRWQDLTVAISQDYSASELGCSINATNTQTARFYVYNWSAGTPAYTIDYNANQTTAATDIAFTYTVADNNGTYRVVCQAIDTTYGVRGIDEIINMRNTSLIYKGFDLNMPNTVLGLSRTFIYGLTMLFILTVVAGLFSARTYGTGAVIFGSGLAMFSYVGYSILPTSIVGTVFFLGLMMKISERRRGVIS